MFFTPIVTFDPGIGRAASRILVMKKEESAMQASIGDRIIIAACHTGDPTHDCEVLEVRGPDGKPPYVVRWGDSGHEAILYPGSDAIVQHFDHAAPS